MPDKFKHLDLKTIEPEFGSELTDLVIELNYLRKKEMGGTTEPSIFFQLKRLFHILESVGSARIEGNRTTVAEFIETKISNKKTKDEKIIEIQNVEEALEFIDNYIGKEDKEINESFLRQLHSLVVKNLTPPPDGEGSNYPGQYRRINVRINGTDLVNPDFTQVPPYMEELLRYINTKDKPKYDLLKTAIAHHRFTWIHPFDNGNGRTVRLLTYAMLVKQGFNVDTVGRIINPTAIFCNDRKDYARELSKADTGTDDGLTSWCFYVLEGLQREIEKIDKLTDYNYLSENILYPTVKLALVHKYITEDEAKVLNIAVKNQIIIPANVAEKFAGKSSMTISRLIKSLRNKKMIDVKHGFKYRYELRFYKNYLTRCVVEVLRKEGFLPNNDEE